MIDYSNLKQGYESSCQRCGYAQREASYNLGNPNGSHMGNYSGSSSNSYDVEAKE